MPGGRLQHGGGGAVPPTQPKGHPGGGRDGGHGALLGGAHGGAGRLAAPRDRLQHGAGAQSYPLQTPCRPPLRPLLNRSLDPL
eukprot:7487416-Pyramimonas_sp.AAC.5